MDDRLAGWFIGTIVAWVGIALLILMLLWGPIIGPWAKHRQGLANYNQAEQERRIQVLQANGERDAAALRAEAIAIVGQAAKDFPEYRQQEYIGAFAESLKHCSGNQIIYVPTEASIPVLEAGKR